MGSISGLGRSPGGQYDNPLQYSCQKNPMNRGVWWATVHRVAELNMKEVTEHTCEFGRGVMVWPTRKHHPAPMTGCFRAGFSQWCTSWKPEGRRLGWGIAFYYLSSSHPWGLAVAASPPTHSPSIQAHGEGSMPHWAPPLSLSCPWRIGVVNTPYCFLRLSAPSLLFPLILLTLVESSFVTISSKEASEPKKFFFLLGP